MPDRNIRRNDPCHCGSGLRFKDCHGALGAPSRTVREPEREERLGMVANELTKGRVAPAHNVAEHYVINLDRSVARLDTFRRRNAHMPEIERFAAIDGAAADRQKLCKQQIISPDLRYTDAALGCALSHLSLWELAATRSRPITICEDDAILHRSFRDSAPRLIDALPQDWEIVLWGWNFDSVLLFEVLPGISPCLARFDQAQLRRAINAFQTRPFSSNLFRLFHAFGTICYSISATGSQKLRARSLPIQNFTIDVPMVNAELANVGIDVVMTAAYSSLKAFVCFPPLAVTENDHPASTIRDQVSRKLPVGNRARRRRG